MSRTALKYRISFILIFACLTFVQQPGFALPIGWINNVSGNTSNETMIAYLFSVDSNLTFILAELQEQKNYTNWQFQRLEYNISRIESANSKQIIDLLSENSNKSEELRKLLSREITTIENDLNKQTEDLEKRLATKNDIHAINSTLRNDFVDTIKNAEKNFNDANLTQYFMMLVLVAIGSGGVYLSLKDKAAFTAFKGNSKEGRTYDIDSVFPAEANKQRDSERELLNAAYADAELTPAQKLIITKKIRDSDEKEKIINKQHLAEMIKALKQEKELEKEALNEQDNRHTAEQVAGTGSAKSHGKIKHRKK